MALNQAMRSLSRTPSTYSTPTKRAQPAPFTPDPRRRRVTIASRPASAYSYQSTNQRTPTGTPAPIAPRGGPDVAREEEDDALDHVVMAVDKSGKTVGCSYYIAREGLLLCMEDVEDVDEGIINNLKLDVQPTIVLLSPRLEIPEQEVARPNSLDLAGKSFHVIKP